MAENAGNLTKARALYLKGCEAGEGAACLGLAKLSSEKSVEYRKWLEKACDLKDSLGCYLSSGVGKRSLSDQRTFLRKACELGLGQGCYQYGELGPVEDSKDRIRWYGKGCVLMHWESCNQMGILTHQSGKSEEAKKIFASLCDQKPELGCNNLGIVEKALGKKDLARAAFEKACHRAKDYGGCNSLGALEKEMGNLQAAQKLYQLACNHGNQLACANGKVK